MSETVEGIMQRIRTHIDAGITGNNVTKADFEARDASHSLGVRYGSLRLLLDEFVATKLQLASALDTIEAAKAELAVVRSFARECDLDAADAALGRTLRKQKEGE